MIGAFAITVNDPSYVIEKIPFKNLQSFLFAYEKIDLIILFSVSIVVIFFLKHLISFSLNFLEITISKKILLNIKKKIFSLKRLKQVYWLKNILPHFIAIH